MSSAIQALKNHNKDTIQKVLDEYRGLREEDLDEMNPEYSCVICEKFYSESCPVRKIYIDVKGCCPEHDHLNIDTFAAKYDFKIGE